MKGFSFIDLTQDLSANQTMQNPRDEMAQKLDDAYSALAVNGDIKTGLMYLVQALQCFDDRLTAIEKKLELHCDGK